MNCEPPLDLHGFARAVHSQYGEDGILAELFFRKDIAAGYFCEFGAWDGKHVSNSFALYSAGWKGCYIEGDPSRFKDLQRNIVADGMALVCAFVTVSGPQSLDSILSRSMPAGTTLDLLSIDIDSDDLAIWESLREIRPKVVVIEYNPTIPIDVYFKNPLGRNRGNSARAIFDYGISQGYDLVAQTSCNLIMIDAEFNAGMFRTFALDEAGKHHGLRYFFGYDGTLMQANLNTGETSESEFFAVPWSNAIMTQPLPRALRHFDDPGPRYLFKSLVTRVSASMRRPLSLAAGRFVLWRGHRGA